MSETTDTIIPLEQFVDLSTFIVGLKAYTTVIASDEHGTQGFALFTKHARKYREALVKYVTPFLSHPGGSRLKSPFHAMMAGQPNLDKVSAFLEILGPWLRSETDVIQNTFTGRSLPAIRGLIPAIVEDAPLSVLNKLAKVPTASSLQLTRKWVQQAATLSGAGLSTQEAVETDAVEASKLALDLAAAESQLSSTEAGDPVKALLAEKRQSIRKELKDLGTNPESQKVIDTVTAVVKATQTNDGYQTEIGRKLKLGPDKEAFLVTEGKILFAATAGSGKTVSLAAKVVDAITRVGLSPSQIIATSFSKKSGAELIARIKKYGGEDIISKSDVGFGTTHSFCFKTLMKYLPAIYGPGKKAIFKSDKLLIMRAIDQVKMHSGRPETTGPEDNEDFLAPLDPRFPIPYDDEKGVQESYTAPVKQSPAPEVPVAPPVAPPPQKEDFPEDIQKWIGVLDILIPWYQSIAKKYPDSSLNAYRRDLFERLYRQAIPPTELSQSERDNVARSIATPMVQDRMKARGLAGWTLPPMGQVGISRTAADEETSGVEDFGLGDDIVTKKIDNMFDSPYTKEPANQWFNLGLKALKDVDNEQLSANNMQKHLSIFKSDMICPREVLDMGPEYKHVAAVYGAIEWLRKNDPVFAQGMFFDDMLVETARLLLYDKDVRDRVQSQYKMILTDEAQDQNKLQLLILGLVSGSYNARTREPRKDGRMTARTLGFIGDDSQAIYGFRGARPELFSQKSDLLGGDFKTLMLETNYRSGSNIVNAAQRLIVHNKNRVPMACKAYPANGEGDVEHVEVKDASAGASYAASAIADRCQGDEPMAKYSDFGVAVRTNAEAAEFCVEFLKRGIPFKTKYNFFNTPMIKAIVWWMRLATNPSKSVLNDCVLNACESPKFGVGPEFQRTLETDARGGNYLDYLTRVDGKIYTYGQTWRNEKSVKPYMQALNKLRSMSKADSQSVLEAVMDLSVNVKTETGWSKASFLDSLKLKIREDTESMKNLEDESSDGRVSDEEVQNLALAPMNPLLDLVKSHPDISQAVKYIDSLQKANEKLGKEDKPEETKPAVVIDTCHGWKGLEVGHIFIPMTAGEFPHARAPVEDERRLAYVAITRGQQAATILSARVGRRPKSGGPSRFISEACIPTRSLRDSLSESEAVDDGDPEVLKTASLNDLEAIWFGMDKKVGG